jgi:iron transport multicopper oxidase
VLWPGKSPSFFPADCLLNRHMSRCVLTALLGMITVVWYALGGHISDDEMEHEVRERLEAKSKRRFFGLRART